MPKLTAEEFLTKVNQHPVLGTIAFEYERKWKDLRGVYNGVELIVGHTDMPFGCYEHHINLWAISEYCRLEAFFKTIDEITPEFLLWATNKVGHNA